MTTTFRLVLPISELYNSNHRNHWTVGAGKRAAMRQAARDACADLAPLTGPVALTVKGAIDGAVDAGVLSDDRSTVLRAITRRPADTLSPHGYAVLVLEFRPEGEVA